MTKEFKLVLNVMG